MCYSHRCCQWWLQVEKLSELLPAGWNCSSDEYTLRYVIDGKYFTLKVLKMDTAALLHLMVCWTSVIISCSTILLWYQDCSVTVTGTVPSTKQIARFCYFWMDPEVKIWFIKSFIVDDGCHFFVVFIVLFTASRERFMQMFFYEYILFFCVLYVTRWGRVVEWWNIIESKKINWLYVGLEPTYLQMPWPFLQALDHCFT